MKRMRIRNTGEKYGIIFGGGVKMVFRLIYPTGSTLKNPRHEKGQENVQT